MILLIGFAFIAGIVTILSPCILPVLPIVLSSSVGEKQDSRRPYGVVIGFVLSFTFFTLFLSSIVSALGIPADSLRALSVVVIGLFGVFMLIPQGQAWLERLFGKLSQFMPRTAENPGFVGGLLVGLSLGLLWTPCVGPILASVISLAITGSVSTTAGLITFAYALGTAIPMLFIIKGGQKALHRIPRLRENLGTIQKVFGVLMIVTAIGIAYDVDRKFQSYILEQFPNYGTGLTAIEDTPAVKEALERLRGGNEMDVREEDMGKPTFEAAEQKGVKAPELIPGGAWFNSEPLTLEKLRGKVVLIDFWTYTCINCQRTFPYLRSWWEEYQDDGLVIIGVHAPEFAFEREADNVAKALEDFELTYPLMQDNNFETWQAYDNRYWPAKYLIDAEGYIRYTHFGEGEYDETEQVIQQLLEEAGAQNLPRETDNPEYTIHSRTRETYLGYQRMQYLASPEQVAPDEASEYSLPNRLPQNRFALQGTWTITPEYAVAEAGNGMQLNFEAKQVFLVMRPGEGEAQVSVLVDGEQEYLGSDVEDGRVIIDEDALYELVELEEPGRHILELEVLEGTVEIYAFTFG